MLLQSECEELIVLAQQGSEPAKSRLIEENMPLIKSIVKRYRNKGVEYDDLYQLGAMGFVKAINNFDLSYGVKFSTYAVPMIMGEIKRFLRDDGYIKVSRSVKILSMKINKYLDEQRKKNASEPRVEDIAAEFGIEPQEVVFALECRKSPVSIYEKDDGNDNSLSLIDRIAAPQGTDLAEIIAVKDLIASLSERERKIIILRFFRDKTQGEIAKQLGVSQVQVSRLESKIIQKLKAELSLKDDAETSEEASEASPLSMSK